MLTRGAGQLEEPWGEDVLEFPSGPPFALLEQATLPWPDATGREAGYRALGRRFDSERRPIFRYALGEIEFEEAAEADDADASLRLFDDDAKLVAAAAARARETARQREGGDARGGADSADDDADAGAHSAARAGRTCGALRCGACSSWQNRQP